MERLHDRLTSRRGKVLRVTISAPDYDTLLASEPDTWQRRGLHFHAYSWRGDGKAMQDNEPSRGDPAGDLPPLAVRDWLAKPRLMSGEYDTPDDAAEWLRGEYEPLIPQIWGDIGQAIGVEQLMRMAVYDLRCGTDTMVARWLRGGTIAYLVVLAVPAGQCGRR